MAGHKTELLNLKWNNKWTQSRQAASILNEVLCCIGPEIALSANSLNKVKAACMEH